MRPAEQRQLQITMSTWLGTVKLSASEGHMGDQEIRAALDRHWAASDAGDFETEHDIYLEDAVLEYPRGVPRRQGCKGNTVLWGSV
jgi:ketosteroid isomerase-like protein